MPAKQDVAKEIGRIASTLTGDMQSAALTKARDLGFGLTLGRLSLEETLINLSNIRDVLLDATEKSKLAHLPLRLQYTLYSQALKVSETLTALVNGTDAVYALEDVVDELTSSAWQYNLHNLSAEVLGFQQKMNQLKDQEILILKALRAAQDFETSSQRAGNLLQEIEGVLTNARKHGEAIDTNMAQASATLAKVAEAEQEISGRVTRAEQSASSTAQYEADANTASSAARTIAGKLPEVEAEIGAAKTSFAELATRIEGLLSSFDLDSTTALTDFQSKRDEVMKTAESEARDIREGITKLSEELRTSAANLLQATAAQLETFQSGHADKLNANIDATNGRASETIEKLDSAFQAALKEQDVIYEDQRANAQGEHNRLVSELDKLEDRIRDSIGRATGYTLFHSFQKRQEDLARSKNWWAWTLAIVIGISVGLSIYFIGYVSSVVTFGPAFYLKLSVSLPIVYAIWFCTVQYSRERRLEEEYAFKSSISISLEPYRDLVERLVVKDKPEELAKYSAFIIESVGRVFTSPMETAFDRNRDSTPAEGVIKATGDVANGIIKLMRK